MTVLLEKTKGNFKKPLAKRDSALILISNDEEIEDEHLLKLRDDAFGGRLRPVIGFSYDNDSICDVNAIELPHKTIPKNIKLIVVDLCGFAGLFFKPTMTDGDEGTDNLSFAPGSSDTEQQAFATQMVSGTRMVVKLLSDLAKKYSDVQSMGLICDETCDVLVQSVLSGVSEN